MLRSIEGVYANGKVELSETPPPHFEGKVIVAFLNENSINLDDLGIDAAQAANLRHRLTTFAEDWDRPEMDIYDSI